MGDHILVVIYCYQVIQKLCQINKINVYHIINIKFKIRVWRNGPVTKSPPCTHWDPMWLPAHVLTLSLCRQFPACDIGKQWRMAQSLRPGAHKRGPKEAPSCWLQTSLAPANTDTWGVDQQMEDISLCIFFSLYICLSNKN